MYSLRRLSIALLGLPMFVSCLVAAEPQRGKLRLVHWFKNPKENLADHAFSTDGKV